jgi:parvulin-like peptidyl-prolyl isomerase
LARVLPLGGIILKFNILEKKMFKKVFVGIVCGMLVLQSMSCSSKKDEGEIVDLDFQHSVAVSEHDHEHEGTEHAPHGSTSSPHGSTSSPHGSTSSPHGSMSSPHGSMPAHESKPADPNEVVATVNGEKIFRRDVNRTLDTYKQFIQPEMLPKLKEQLINDLITQSLLKNHVSAQNIEVKQEEVDEGLDAIRKNLKDNPATADHALEEVLESQGQTLEDLKEKLTIQIALKQYFEKDINDAQLQEYFQKNIDMYCEDTVTASHILVDTRKLTTSEEQDEAKGKIEGIKKEIDDGADFAEMAKQHSDCPSKEKGGDLGAFPRRGAMIEPFAAAAFNLEIGEVSDPVKTDFGYHLIKVTARNKGKEITFEGVKDKVKATLKEQKTGELIKNLWETATIEKS